MSLLRTSVLAGCVAAATAFALGACHGAEAGVSASNYDRSCNADRDCAIGEEVSVSSDGECMPTCGDAVNARVVEQMDNDTEARLSDCPHRAYVDCNPLGVICAEHTCKSYRCQDFTSCPAPPH
jgi:hypothetical protein